MDSNLLGHVQNACAKVQLYGKTYNRVDKEFNIRLYITQNAPSAGGG